MCHDARTEQGTASVIITRSDHSSAAQKAYQKGGDFKQFSTNSENQK